MNGRILSMAPLDKKRCQCAPQRQVVGAIDLADAKRWLALGAGYAHLALIVDAVCGVRLVLVREHLTVTGALRDVRVTRDEPESAVVLVPRDRTPRPQVGVDLEFVLAVLV